MEDRRMAVIPVAKAVYLCDRHAASAKGKVDLHGLFNSIRPKQGYPFLHSRFCVFAQLVNGLGQTLIDIDVRSAETDEFVYTTETLKLTFPDRITVIHIAVNIEGCRFDKPGLYIVELLCNNTWVSDTSILLT
jgi:hypothetical protein